MSGKVYLVGAGPGDPELLTLKAKGLIEKAQVIVYDALVGPKIVESLPRNAELIDCGKRKGYRKLTQEEINELLLQKAKEGMVVVRLKGGDPLIFGRGGEEMEYLAEQRISFEVVPGISSAIAGPAYAMIPLTHRNLASSVTFVTGHEDLSKQESIVWESIVRAGGTLVILMGISRLGEITRALMKGGLDPKTPVAIVEQATLPKQRVISGSLKNITKLAEERGAKPPAIIVVGRVVAVREKVVAGR
jgi:uroporphyrin-III C-methyltransferase